ncbi:hypothetical protein HK097_005411, partial [Rhizophlyctis rosea]
MPTVQTLAQPPSPHTPQIFLSRGSRLEPDAKEIENRKFNRRLKAAHSLVQKELRVLRGFHHSQPRSRWDFSLPERDSTIQRERSENTVPLPVRRPAATKENILDEPPSTFLPHAKVPSSKIPLSTPSQPLPQSDSNVEPIRKDLGETKIALQQLLEVQRVQQKEM